MVPGGVFAVLYATIWRFPNLSLSISRAIIKNLSDVWIATLKLQYIPLNFIILFFNGLSLKNITGKYIHHWLIILYGKCDRVKSDKIKTKNQTKQNKTLILHHSYKSWQYDASASDGKAVQRMKNSVRGLQRELILIVDWNISIYFSKWKKSNKPRSWKNVFWGNRETWIEGNIPILQLLLMVLWLYYILLIHISEERILYFQNSLLVSDLLLTCKSFKELRKKSPRYLWILYSIDS